MGLALDFEAFVTGVGDFAADLDNGPGLSEPDEASASCLLDTVLVGWFRAAPLPDLESPFFFMEMLNVNSCGRTKPPCQIIEKDLTHQKRFTPHAKY